MGAISRAPRRPGVVEDTGMCGSSLRGNRETPRPTSGALPVWSASGRRGAVADDARTWGSQNSAIVAGKPTNKAERSAAEPVEPRAEAEGNASQQSTGRAQSRETVSQALERIRQAARQRKKEKFTALLHHISIELLDEAFFELKEDAAPGVDGLSGADYEAKP